MNAAPIERRRSRLAPRSSIALTIVMVVLVLYTLVPLAYLLINSTKSQDDFFTSFGLAFGSSFNLFQNIGEVFSYNDGIYSRWFLNTVLYVVVSAGGATILAALGGYGIAKFRFRGRSAVFAVVLGAVAIPGTALALPTFLLFSSIGLVNTPWAIIIPSLVSPFGLYLMWTYASEAVPSEILEAARIDGAGEFRTFFTVSIRLLAPGLVTVLLFSIVTTWNNYFLPLIMLSDPKWYPLTLGLAQWNAQSTGTNADPIQNLIITGSLLAIIPLVVVFLLLQRYWQSGLAAGSVKA
ncbi:carbohydrate ABC transporter permease [Herbiconiux sp. VKM Ac-1786]|uniref:carbohydrate ABC transporter permease n=1 Tax=Herbiconiux sp. VKM Ac-1786 TaxID=2783824 RepID=UPI00188D827F|nr:carbohydrate ABC transporter permease [Herbiconiux sp. VKM Ac-1786]MBF4572404.1 carbohydrate ABC transporter permease [Herbiconiux sp. VKM Ac-1786]